MNLEKIMILVILLGITLSIIFLWFRKTTIKKEKKQLKRLHQEFIEKPSPETGEPSREDEEILERIIEKIEEATDNEEKSVGVYLKEGFSLEVETPDVISLKTPRGTLYKSFSNVKFRKIVSTDDEVKLHLANYNQNKD